MLCFSRSSLYQYPRLNTTSRAAATATFIAGEPTSPISMAATVEAAECLFFDFGVPSKLIRIIGRQNSSGPTPPQLPIGRRSARSVPLPVLELAAQSAGMDYKSAPAARTPGAGLRPGP